MDDLLTTLRQSRGFDGDADAFFTLAQQLAAKDDLHQAATAYDRAFGLAPDRQDIAQARMRLLDQLSVTDHDIAFRYIPAGTFLMGSDNGDPDEQPVHSVELDHFWMAELPLHWGVFNGHSTLFRLLPNPLEPARGVTWPPVGDERLATLELGAKSGLSHNIGYIGRNLDIRSQLTTDESIYPIISVNWNAAVNFCDLISTETITYRLPTEAEWEKAARGGLINKKYPWGDESPTQAQCDFNHFGEFTVFPIDRYPANNYGLRVMSGSVWEWVSDWYDAEYYQNTSRLNPQGAGGGTEKVIRGGSWADSEEALTVSFRASWGHRGRPSPNVGFRLCRVS